MQSSFLLLAVLFVSLAVVSTSSDSGCHSETCRCIRRGTFDQKWLNATYPALAVQYKAYTFSTPNITYPNCTAIISTCPTGSQVAKILDGKISIGGVLLKNPYVLSNIICDEVDGWVMNGVNQGLDDNLKASNISCATKV